MVSSAWTIGPSRKAEDSLTREARNRSHGCNCFMEGVNTNLSVLQGFVDRLWLCTSWC